MDVNEIVSAKRIRWELLDTHTIRQVRTEAGAAGDTELVRRADRELRRRRQRRDAQGD